MKIGDAVFRTAWPHHRCHGDGRLGRLPRRTPLVSISARWRRLNQAVQIDSPVRVALCGNDPGTLIADERSLSDTQRAILSSW